MSFVRNLKLLNSLSMNTPTFKFSSTPRKCETIRSLLQNTFPVSSLSLRQYSSDKDCCYVPVPPDHCKPVKVDNTKASFCDVTNVRMTSCKLVVDVRDCEEIEALGKIPKTAHIPLCHIHVALTYNEKEFNHKYGCPAPHKSADLIFYSNQGCRSKAAMLEARRLGFCKARNYKGGYNDYLKKSRLPREEVCGDGCKKKKKK